MSKLRRGFTLVELLVVVAIIALLIALLLPGLNSARELAKRVTCGAQVKQVGAAHVMYSQDSQGAFLAYNSNSSMVWGGRAGTWAGYGAPNWTPARRPLNPYLGVGRDVADDADVLVARCPSDTGHGPKFANTVTVYRDVGASYIYNAFSINPGVKTLPGRRVTDIRRPDYVLVSGDHNLHNYIGGGNRFEYWHDKQQITANVLFVDTHVAYVPVVSTNVGPDYAYLPDAQ